MRLLVFFSVFILFLRVISGVVLRLVMVLFVVSNIEIEVMLTLFGNWMMIIRLLFLKERKVDLMFLFVFLKRGCIIFSLFCGFLICVVYEVLVYDVVIR